MVGETERIRKYNQLITTYQQDTGPNGIVTILKENNDVTNAGRELSDLILHNEQNRDIKQWRIELKFESLVHKILKLHGKDHRNEKASQFGILQLQEELKQLQARDQSWISLSWKMAEYNRICKDNYTMAKLQEAYNYNYEDAENDLNANIAIQNLHDKHGYNKEEIAKITPKTYAEKRKVFENLLAEEDKNIYYLILILIFKY